jgi:hypothetical protein
MKMGDTEILSQVRGFWTDHFYAQAFSAMESQLQVDAPFLRFMLNNHSTSCDMTSQVINTLPAMGFDLAKPLPSSASSSAKAVIWQRLKRGIEVLSKSGKTS